MDEMDEMESKFLTESFPSKKKVQKDAVPGHPSNIRCINPDFTNSHFLPRELIIDWKKVETKFADI